MQKQKLVIVRIGGPGGWQGRLLAAVFGVIALAVVAVVFLGLWLLIAVGVAVLLVVLVLRAFLPARKAYPAFDPSGTQTRESTPNGTAQSTSIEAPRLPRPPDA